MEPASAIFEAELVEHLGPGANQPGAIVPGLRDALMAEEPSHVDLVVRRRDDGTELVRTPADLGSPDDLLAAAQHDLATMSVEEFVAEWQMPQARRSR
ncbi:MAG TPA: hypothetical protein VGI56_01825 [Galbitalea sp.]|jgi:hypothetical protein